MFFICLLLLLLLPGEEKGEGPIGAVFGPLLMPAKEKEVNLEGALVEPDVFVHTPVSFGSRSSRNSGDKRIAKWLRVRRFIVIDVTDKLIYS